MKPNIGTLNGPVTSTSSDTRRGSGYGSTVSNKTGLGRDHNMGDALSSPIGPFDDVESRMFADQDEDLDKSDIDIHNGMLGSLSHGTDSYAKSKRDIGSFVPHANSVAAVLAQGYDRGSDSLLREFISEALHEVTSMSVRVMVKGSLGDTYKSSKANISNVNQMSPGDPSIKQKGYGQRVGTKDMYPYIKAGMPTTDGGETMRRVSAHIENDDEFDWNDPNYTTSDHLIDTMDQDYLDRENVQRHNRRFK